MSVPRENLDQLLSGYLDGVLSGDEQDRIEQLVREDVSVARELQELRNLRATLKEIDRIDHKHELDDGFADRVLAAAVQRARDEGLSDEHPLIGLSEQPSTPIRRHSTAYWVRAASMIVAVAASIAVAIVVLHSPEQGNHADTPIAKLDDKSTSENLDPVPGNALIANVSEPDRTAEDAADGPTGTLDPPVKDSGQPDEQAVKIASTPKPVDSQANKPATEPVKTTLADLEAQLNGGAFLFVIKAQRTPEGRATRSVRDAMVAAGLTGGERKEISKGMVQFLERDLDDSGSTQVMYLEASAKKVDVLINRLVADEKGIANVALNLAPSAPVRRVVDELRPIDPKSIQQSPVNWDLQGSGVDKLAAELQAQVYGQIKRGKFAGLPMVAPQGDGPDQRSQILLLIQ